MGGLNAPQGVRRHCCGGMWLSPSGVSGAWAGLEGASASAFPFFPMTECQAQPLPTVPDPVAGTPPRVSGGPGREATVLGSGAPPSWQSLGWTLLQPESWPALRCSFSPVDLCPLPGLHGHVAACGPPFRPRGAVRG